MTAARILSLGSLSLGFSVSAQAFVPSKGRTETPSARSEAGVPNTPLEAASGARLRLGRRVTRNVPAAQGPAWKHLKARLGSDWTGYFDADTQVPQRLWGHGIKAPNVQRSAERAAEVSNTFLAEHIALLAPGAKPSDFVLVANDLDAQSGIRTVAFLQSSDGLTVRGGQVSFRFKADRLFVIGSEAWPNVQAGLARGDAQDGPSANKPAEPASDAAFRSEALKWMLRSTAEAPNDDAASLYEVRSGPDAPIILPLVEQSGIVRYHAVRRVRIDSRNPIGAWDIFLDAKTARPVAREQTLRFLSGTLRLDVPDRYPTGPRSAVPAPNMNVRLAGAPATTDAAGLLTWSGASTVDLVTSVEGPDVEIANKAGAPAVFDTRLSDGDTVTWREASDEFADAQLTTFVALTRAKVEARVLAPNISWLFEDVAPGNVNLDDTCNAYSDGTSVNFFRASTQCENTGRIPDVVYHEFGHSLHAHAIIRGAGDFDTALSEGVSDYFAASITKDPGVGRGFTYSDQPLRHIDPPNAEASWPADVGEPHDTGLIISGALWDLRTALEGGMSGNTANAADEHVNFLMLQIMRRAADIPSSYVEALAADDDDGDLANGTPNICAINAAFARHGLADPSSIGPVTAPPRIERGMVVLPVDNGHGFCPGTAIASANLEWRARVTPPANGGSGNQIAMQATTDGLVASLPSASDGTVLQYRVQVTLESGAVLSFPDNPADPYYETFVGDVIPLYCTDFESDPAEDGWHNALLEGTNTEGANDWQWGVSAGTAGSGDPAAAYSGTRVYGNDLGGGDYNGKYQADKVTALYAPVIDVGDHTNIHLQYRRWLTVESGNYDQATIWSNETKVWHNLVPTNGPDVHHEDREWRFQDVDLSSTLTDDHKVQIQFTLNSDGGLEFGGWTIDDFCVVAVPEVPTAVCGNGTVDPEEMCDDGNTDDGDGCSAVCTIEAKPEPVCGNGEIEGDETCDDGNAQNGDGCSADCAIEPPPEPSCGNGEVEGDEACDDGNEQDGDGCEHDCTLTPTDGTGPGSDDGTTPSDGSDGTGSNGSDGSGTSNGSDGANGGADGSDGETSQCTAGTDCPSTVPGPTAPPDGGGCSCQLKVDASNTFGAAAGRSILFILGFAVWIVRRRR